jgi:lantibiotic biosynthesis protein
LLINELYPIIQQLRNTHIISQFYFVRYQDQDAHLRLRFRGNPHVEFYHHTMRAIERALNPYTLTGQVHKIQTDTYQRELERYGMHRIELCEALFHADSLSTMQFLAQTGEAFDENLRFGFALYKIDAILTGLPCDTLNPQMQINNLKEQFFLEFNGNPALRQQLNDNYRVYRPLIEQSLSRPFPLQNGQQNWVADQQNLLQELATQTPDAALLQSIVGSLIHMAVNRLFPSKQRAYELVLYHCLAKQYTARQAQVS